MPNHKQSGLDHKLRDISVMYELMSSIGTSLDMKAELDRFLNTLLKRFGYSLGAILRKDLESDSFIVASASGYLKAQDIVGQKYNVKQYGIRRVCSSKEALVRNTLTGDENDLIIIPDILEKIKSFAFIPILFEEEVLGILRLFSFTENAFPDKSLRMLTPLVKRLGKAINHIATVEKLQSTEDSLRKEQEFTEAALNSLADIFLVFDPNSGAPIRWNKRFETVSGYTAGEIGQMKIPDDWCAPEDRDRITATLKQIETYKFEKIELPLVTKDGKHIPTEFSSSLLHGNNNEGHYIITLGRDISERKQAEKEKKNLEAQLRQSHKMEAIGTLAGGIAHDFNNVLSIILGFSEMAKHRTVEGKSVETELAEVIKAGNRASDLVKQILTYGRKSDEFRDVLDLHKMINETIKFLRASIPSTIEIEENICTTGGYILADATQIHQILMNLCGNAAQAMEVGGGTLTIELSEQILSAKELHGNPNLHPGKYVKLAISDTGIGIDPLTIHRIFDPYFTTKKVGKGSGMGLAVVQGIVSSHDGMIKVASAPGQKTTFSVYFLQQKPFSSPDEAPSIPETFPTTTGEHILLVDDEVDLAEIGKQFLEKAGYRVTVQTHSTEALEIFQASPLEFDLLITDQTMPQVSGVTLCQEVMKIKPELPTIICSGFNTQIDQEKAEKLGIKKYLTKPISYKKLASEVRKLLDKR